jgi:hypothetical protein
MRTFSGTSVIYSPEAIIMNRIQPEQKNMNKPLEKDECDPGRTGINNAPYRTEFRNL